MRLSIITVNLRNPDGLIRTAESIKQQNVAPYEWLIVDGGSGAQFLDYSAQLMRDVSFLRVTSERDTGIYDAMNKGIRESTGDVVMFLNSGDQLYNNNSVESITHALETCNSDVWLFGFLYKQQTFKPKPTWWRFVSLPTSHQSIVYKRSLLSAENFSTELRIAADFEHFLRIAKTPMIRISRNNTPIISNEVYGCESKLGQSQQEYLAVLRRHIPGLVARTIVKLKFLSVRVRLLINRFKVD